MSLAPPLSSSLPNLRIPLMSSVARLNCPSASGVSSTGSSFLIWNPSSSFLGSFFADPSSLFGSYRSALSTIPPKAFAAAIRVSHVLCLRYGTTRVRRLKSSSG